MRNSFLLSVALFLYFSIALAQNKLTVFSAAATQLQKDLLLDSMQGSIAITVFHKNDLLWSNAFGNADRAMHLVADTSSIFRIASLTKSFTATLLMKLVEQGTIKLDDPVEMYVPEIKQMPGYSSVHSITLRQLATHTAGLERRPNTGNIDEGDITEWENNLLKFLPFTSVIHTPGSKFHYSNIGYVILGLALERVAHKPYIQLIEETILKPLKLEHTFFILPQTLRSKLAIGIDKDSTNHILYVSGNSMTGYGIPAGGIYSTTGDLVKFLQSQIGIHPIIAVENLHLMHTGERYALGSIAIAGIQTLSVFLSKENKQIARLVTHSKYGIGFSVYQYKDIYAIGHSGRIAGYSSQFYVDKNSGYGIVILRNYAEGNTNLDIFAINLLEKLKDE